VIVSKTYEHAPTETVDVGGTSFVPPAGRGDRRAGHLPAPPTRSADGHLTPATARRSPSRNQQRRSRYHSPTTRGRHSQTDNEHDALPHQRRRSQRSGRREHNGRQRPATTCSGATSAPGPEGRIRHRRSSSASAWHAVVSATTRSPCRLHGLLRVSREGPSETRQVRPHRQTSSASSASRRVLRSSKAEARRLACSGLGRLLLFVHRDSAGPMKRRRCFCLKPRAVGVESSWRKWSRSSVGPSRLVVTVARAVPAGVQGRVPPVRRVHGRTLLRVAAASRSRNGRGVEAIVRCRKRRAGRGQARVRA
jgi:hypothetical protein